MNKKLSLIIFVALFSVIFVPQIVYCQTETPGVSPTEEAQPASGLDPLLIGAIVAAVVIIVVVAVVFVFLRKKGVSEDSLRKIPVSAFQEWVIEKFNGKPSDPSTGVTGLTRGGQPLLILQTENVSLAEVDAFINVLVKGKAQKGTIVAFGFGNDSLEGKIKALDNEIMLEMLRVKELLNKRFARRLSTLASAPVAFTPFRTFVPPEPPTAKPALLEELEKTPNESPEAPVGIRPKIFVSYSSSEVADQLREMLEFLHYDFVVGDKEEATVPISESKFELMRNCDCAVINIAAAEQERRYSGMYILNSNITSEVNAAYLKYDTQVVLLVERKVNLPPNFTGLNIIQYDNDDLSFNAAMELKKVLADFKKL